MIRNRLRHGIRTRTKTHFTISACQKKSTNIVSCDEWRPFWVRWGGSLVEVGVGTVPGASRMIHMTDEPSIMDINAVSFAAGDVAEWYLIGATGTVLDMNNSVCFSKNVQCFVLFPHSFTKNPVLSLCAFWSMKYKHLMKGGNSRFEKADVVRRQRHKLLAFHFLCRQYISGAH